MRNIKQTKPRVQRQSTSDTAIKKAHSAEIPRTGAATWIRADSPFLTILILSCILLLSNLGGQCLWQDEAQTALVARTILTQGTPHGYDGRNYFSQDVGAEYGRDYLWKWHTWLQFYVVAPFIALLGSTTIAARLPFALFGVGTVILTYFTALRMWKSRKLAVFSMLLLTTSIPFLLFSRQCRYYSPAMFFSVLALYAYVGFLDNKRYSLPLFVGSSILLLHTHYGYCGVLMAAVAIHSLLFHRAHALRVIIACAAVALVNLPVIRWFTSIQVNEAYGDVSSYEHFITSLSAYATSLAMYVFNPILIAIPIASYLFRCTRDWKIHRLDRRAVDMTLLLSVLSVFTLLAFAKSSPVPYLRYLAPLVPVTALLAALILDRLRTSIAIGVFVVMLLGSPILSLFWRYGGSNNIATYLYEITHQYRGPVDGIVRHLNTHAKPRDIVLITYEDLPLKYYTNLRVYGGLTGENLSGAKNADWVIVRTHIASTYELPVREFIANDIDGRNYEKITIDYPDAPFQNREDPRNHLWKTPTGFPKVTIFHRKTEGAK